MNDPALIPNKPAVSMVYRPVQLAENPLTKREEFAKAAMQGLCANQLFPEWSFTHLAQLARKQADALIAELDAHPNP
jgi:hypothetical protein